MSLFQPLDHQNEARRASIAADLSKFYAEMAGAAPKPTERFSLSRMIARMDDGTLAGTYEAGVCQAAAIAQGRNWADPRSQIIPWGALMGRALTTSIPASGGNLTSARPISPLDVLRPFSVVARMGISTEENLTQDLLVPNVTTPATAQWLATETTPITSSSPVIGQIASQPKTAGTLVKASLNFMKQSRFADGAIRTQLLGALGAALDQAVLAGTGSSGQPTGLSAAAGVNEQSGAVTLANMLDAVKVLANAKADDEKIRFLTTPDIRRLLQAREATASTGRMLWKDDQLADKPASVTTDCPAATIFAGDWSTVLLALWGTGIEIIVDPYTNFKTGGIQVRALLHADVAFTKPQAMLRHTSAT